MMKKKWLIVIAIVGTLFLSVFSFGEEKKKGNILVYKIVERTDLSMKTLIKKLSSYSSLELSQLPINKRLRYKILVKPGLLKEEYDKLINKIIYDITTKDKDIDEISLWIYDDDDALDFGYNVARVLWHPAGGWGFTVTPEIATSNDRTGYKTTIEWTDKYKLKFKYGQKIEKTTIRKKRTVGSEFTYYRCSVTYPEEVGLNEVNDIKLTITNLTTMSDTELVIHNTRFIMENGEFVSYTKEEKSPFKIIRIEPEPQSIDNFFGMMGIYYKGLKAKEPKDIILYFRLIKEGIYRCAFTFYTDKYADDENEVIPEINIKCNQ